MGASSLVAGMKVATSLLITSFPISKTGTYDLLFRQWPRLETERIVSEILTTLTTADDEYYVYLAWKECRPRTTALKYWIVTRIGLDKAHGSTGIMSFISIKRKSRS